MPIQFVFSVASAIGVVAQLGEHLPCTQGVGSSILPGSTNEAILSNQKRRPSLEGFVFCFEQKLIKNMVEMCVHKHKGEFKYY